MSTYTAAKPFVWIESPSGTTYLCPKDALENPRTASEEELRRYCIDESENPHNN